ncbi:MAG: DEAD/DEAH box helicase [Candidatus Eisenbacteria bacterium]
MVVPKDGREHFLGLLASSFTSVADALASHMRVHRARPLVTLDLGADDWLHVRLFAHTGDGDWRPGADVPGVVAFELNSEAEWTKLETSAAGMDLAGSRARLGDVGGAADSAVNAEAQASAGADADEAARTRGLSVGANGSFRTGASAGAAAVSADPASSSASAASSAANAAAEADAPPVWVEVPDPAPIEPVREWMAMLPLSRRGKRVGVAAPAPRIPEEPVRDDGQPDDEAAQDAAAEDGDAAPAVAAPAPEFGAWIRLGARTLNTFAEVWEQRPRQVTFLGNERMRTLLGERRAVRARVTVTASGVDWFTVSAEWRAEGQALTDEELARLRGSANRFVKLKSGWVSREWVEAYDAEAAMLADLGLEAGGGEQRLTLVQLAQARPESLAALEGLGEEPGTLREIARLREQVRNFTGLPRIPVPAGLKATLRPYQHDGLDFLAFVTELGMGAVLADDMGLGKTVQALAWIEWLRERDPNGGPVLVVCPASVVHNWQRESERFTPHLRVLVLASGEERLALRKEVPQHDLVITNYSLLRRDIEYWKSIPLRAAILDEAQNIKNPKAAVSRAVLELNARHRMALTGTPIENRALDLWSIMQFVNPGHLGRRNEFVGRYDRPDAPAHARRLLAARLRPVMVRRLKEQVAPDLPDRIEERRECELTPGQRKLYLAELMRGREAVERLKASPEGVMRNKIEVLALLTRLRQVCCHPTLVGGREDLGSGKFDTLFEILEPLMAEGRKVLVFSQFVECLKLLAAEMKRRGIRYHLLTGATTRREEVVTAFEKDPEPCVFLISLKAGGTGLNLTAAQYVVLFDPWWNPAVEAQAIDRTHRIGQTRTVIAYRMLAAGTIEQKIWELQQRKQTLVSEVLGEDGFARTLTAGDLDYLLG